MDSARTPWQSEVDGEPPGEPWFGGSAGASPYSRILAVNDEACKQLCK
jgi:hypothetical protein